MNLLKLDGLNLHYGEQIIFDGLSLVLQPGERLCIVGRNGVGKSTLLKVLEGLVDPDGGGVWRNAGLRIASLAQELPEADQRSVYDFVAGGLPELGRDLARFAVLSQRADERSLNEMGQVQQRIEAADGWRVQNRIEQTLTRLQLSADTPLSDLSGGWRRRVALAQALVSEPDLLLLDEPTNHLDIPSIEWLEKQLLEFPGAVVFVTHDRAFLTQVANRIGELDRGTLNLWDGDYRGFLAYRAQQLAEEEKHNAAFDKRLAQEEVWIRQGVKARRTRNEGRVRALEKMRAARAARQGRLGTANMALAAEGSSGKLVAEFNQVTFGWQQAEPIVKDFTSTIVRGDKIGLIGPNGVGKSTFLKLLVGELQPSSGTVRLGSKLEMAYFDQLRDQLDLDKSAMDNIAEGREFIEINGQNKHVISYLQDFLFSGERARTPIRSLSGGERNRVLLAKLFSKSANLLIMDEPTNDLDVQTLELLEELLIDYDGTLLLVSHDRAFLDNVVTSTIGFEGAGVLKEYVGGYDDWQRQGGVWPGQAGDLVDKSQGGAPSPSETAATKPAATARSKKLSYKLQLELDTLPGLIETVEKELEALHAKVSSPEFYQGPADEIDRATAQLAEQETKLETYFHRWEELEALRTGG